MSRLSVLALLVLVTSAVAAEVKIGSSEIDQLLTDHSLYAVGRAGPIEQIFQKSGATFYLENGNASQGNWKIEKDQYCSKWPPNPSWACYDILRDEDRVIFLSKSGERFPMTTHK